MLSTTNTDSPKAQPASNLDWALKYASMGLRVFPLQPCTKRPMTEHGVKDATGSESLIREWRPHFKRAEDAMEAVERKLFGGI
jgi:hypothetical protein